MSFSEGFINAESIERIFVKSNSEKLDVSGKLSVTKTRSRPKCVGIESRVYKERPNPHKKLLPTEPIQDGN